MEKELLQEFSNRVIQANRSQLVVTIYDIILASLADGRVAFQKGDTGEFKHSMERAQSLVMELVKSLDFNYKISYDLFSLYLFVNRRILHTLARNKIELLDGTDKVIKNLRDAFEKVSRQDDSPPLMANTQKIYAGLTYGKGSDLSEMYQEDSNRGFQA